MSIKMLHFQSSSIKIISQTCCLPRRPSRLFVEAARLFEASGGYGRSVTVQTSLLCHPLPPFPPSHGGSVIPFSLWRFEKAEIQ